MYKNIDIKNKKRISEKEHVKNVYKGNINSLRWMQKFMRLPISSRLIKRPLGFCGEAANAPREN